jgi:uroporphyrinogen-III decarboxylase
MMLNERLHRLQAAMNLETPDRVPIVHIVDSWAAGYAGYSIKEMSYDYDKMVSAFEKVFTDFPCDGFRLSFSRPARVYQALESKEFLFSDSSNADVSLQFKESSPMKIEEYSDLIKDPLAFMFKKLPTRYGKLSRPFPENMMAFAKGALLFANHGTFIKNTFKRWQEEFGIPFVTRGGGITPFDILGDYLRGFKGVMLDIKRNPDNVKAACEALLPLSIKLARVSYGSPASFPPIFLPIHLGSFLRLNDFREFYWPTFKKLVETMTMEGYTWLIFFEGNWESYLGLLTELPKKKIIGLFENTNMKKVKATLGNNICLAGGFPTTLLGHGTEKECIDYAKQLLDTVAPGGGYIFSSDKTLISIKDAKPNNLTAVANFVKEYGKY